MKFNISEEDKKRILESNIVALENQLYTEIVFLGLNPDEFEPSFLDDKDSPEDNLIYSRLKDLLSRLEKLKAML